MVLLTCFLSFNSGHVVVIDLNLKQNNIFTFSQKVDICGLDLSFLDGALNDVPKLELFLFIHSI